MKAASMEASVEAVPVKDCAEAFVEVASVEVASAEAFVEVASLKASVKAFMEASVEISSAESFVKAFVEVAVKSINL